MQESEKATEQSATEKITNKTSETKRLLVFKRFKMHDSVEGTHRA